MKSATTLLILGLASLGLSQTFTASSTSGTGTSATGISLSSLSATPVSGAGTWTLNGTTSLANPFSRFDVRINTLRTIANYNGTISGNDPTSSTTIPDTANFATPVTTTLVGINKTTGGQSSGTISTLYGMAGGQSFGLSATISPDGVQTTASIALAAAQAPLATSSALTGSVATAGSPTVPQLSTASLWVFDFPGNPATGTATLNLSNASATFSRALDSLGLASRHRDNTRIEVAVFLNGVQVGATKISATNTALGVGTGATAQNISYTSIPSVTLTPADIYNQTKSLTVVTKLIGTAYLGNSTQLGDYTIAQSTFSGISVQGVPEPASIAGLSLGLLAFARRRRSK